MSTTASRASVGPAGPPCGRALDGPNCTSPPPGAPRADAAVALDALHLERRTDDRRPARDREEQGDEPLAPPGIVAGEVFVVGTGRCDEEIEPAGLELGPSPLEAAGEDFRGEGGLLGGGNAERGTRNAEQIVRAPVPRSHFRLPSCQRCRNCAGCHEKLPPLHRPSSS